MRRLAPTFAIALAVLCLGVSAPWTFASSTFPAAPSIEQLARRADLVVLGDVTAAVGEWDAARTNIHTRVEIVVTETLKGAAVAAVSFTLLGGQVGEQMSVVGGAAKFQAGERVLVFLTRRADGSLRLADLLNAKFSIERDPATNRDYAVRATGAPGADRIELNQARTDVRRALGERG